MLSCLVAVAHRRWLDAGQLLESGARQLQPGGSNIFLYVSRRRSSRYLRDHFGPLEQPGEPYLQGGGPQLTGNLLQNLQRFPVLPQRSPWEERDPMLLAVMEQAVS